MYWEGLGTLRSLGEQTHSGWVEDMALWLCSRRTAEKIISDAVSKGHVKKYPPEAGETEPTYEYVWPQEKRKFPAK